MDYYLIDLENVRRQGLMGADLLGTNDTIVIFYSNVANSIRAIDRERIEQGSAKVEIRSVNVHTKNALDFELSIYVGILISSVFPEHIYIISEDNGYKAVLDGGNREFAALGRKEQAVFLCRTILEGWYQKTKAIVVEQPDKAVSVKTLPREVKIDPVVGLTAGELSLDPIEFARLVDSSSGDRRKLYLTLLHVYGREKGLKAYRMIIGH